MLAGRVKGKGGIGGWDEIHGVLVAGVYPRAGMCSPMSHASLDSSSHTDAKFGHVTFFGQETSSNVAQTEAW